MMLESVKLPWSHYIVVTLYCSGNMRRVVAFMERDNLRCLVTRLELSSNTASTIIYYLFCLTTMQGNARLFWRNTSHGASDGNAVIVIQFRKLATVARINSTCIYNCKKTCHAIFATFHVGKRIITIVIKYFDICGVNLPFTTERRT